MRLKIGLPVLALLLAASTALGQNAQSQTSSEPLKLELPEREETAHCAYAPTDTICEANAPSGNAPADHDTLAQLPGHMPPPPSHLHEAPMGGPYRGSLAGAPDGRHVLIGAAIGFGLGAAAGSKSGVRASFGIGALFGFIGAGIGAGIQSFPHPSRYRRRWDDDEEASNRRLRHKAQPKRQYDSGQQTALASPNPPESPTKQSNYRIRVVGAP